MPIDTERSALAVPLAQSTVSTRQRAGDKHPGRPYALRIKQ